MSTPVINNRNKKRRQRDMEGTIYPRKIVEKARRLWLLGYSLRSIAKLEGMPGKGAITEWSHRFNWKSDLAAVQAKVAEKRIENIATELAKMDEEQLALLSKMRKKIAQHLKVEGMLEARDIQSLSLALDKAIKNERLIKGAVTERSEAETSINIGWKEIIYGTTQLEPPAKPE